jgi:RNAse (barnase) inhibitor barstar
MYALVDDETGNRLGEFRDIERFFVAEPGEYHGSASFAGEMRAPIDFEIVDVDPRAELANLPERLSRSNLIVEILSDSGGAIGGYYVASAVLRSRKDAATGQVNVGVSGLVDWIPHRDAKNLWAAWAVAPPTRKGIWAEFPIGSREAWLEVVGLYRSASSRTSNDVAEVLIDGARIEDLASFFCAMGEAVNGPGGYYGWNLQSLADCLGGGCGARAPFVLRWSEFDVAQRSLVGEVESADRCLTQLELIVQVLQEAGVDIRT